MTWLEDTALRDLDETVIIEATCVRCLHTWRQSPTQLLLKVIHRNVYLDEVAKNLSCLRPGCRYLGVRVTIIKQEETSSFVGGMP